MKILLVHNQYRQKGGEDMVFADEYALLKNSGHEVRVYLRSNDELARVKPLPAAVSSFWSASSHQDLERIFTQWRPDIMHVHNTFYAISASIYWAAAKHGIAVVKTLHNFRLLCLQASFSREGKVCEDCLGKLPILGMCRGCHQGSISQSVALGANLMLHRGLGTFRTKVHRFICLSEFSRLKFIEAGFDPSRLVVKPNFAPRPTTERKLDAKGGLYIGRLSAEKGVAVLAQAMGSTEFKNFTVAGTGPDEAVFAPTKANLVGWQTQDKLAVLLAAASYMVIPSLTYEQFPRVLAEAFSFGLPVIAPSLGSLSTLVRDWVTGLHFKPGDSVDLARVLAWAESHPDEMRVLGTSARAQYEAEFSPEVGLTQLISIYTDAIACQRDSMTRKIRSALE